ncbi:MAG: DUF308 domain-containing protein [Alistipes sp.]|nr:DUF308 domain-containing protein [Alistipes sp.]
MTEQQYEQSEYLINRWWLSLLIGIMAIAIGFLVLVNPVGSYYTFALWMGLAILLSGVMGLVQSLTSQNYFVRRGWLVLASVADIIIGIILLFNSLLAEMTLPLLLGFWLLYRGCVMLAQGFDLRSYGMRDAGWVIFYSIIVIALGIAVIWLPSTLGAEVVILFIAIGFITYGVSIISLAFRLWEVHRHARALGSDE